MCQHASTMCLKELGRNFHCGGMRGHYALVWRFHCASLTDLFTLAFLPRLPPSLPPSLSPLTRAVFSRLTAQPHLKSFRDSLLVFVKHFLSPKPSSSPSYSLSLPDPPASSSTKESLLRHRLQLVEQIMRTPQAIA